MSREDTFPGTSKVLGRRPARQRGGVGVRVGTRYCWLSNLHALRLWGPCWWWKDLPRKRTRWWPGVSATYGYRSMGSIGSSSFRSVRLRDGSSSTSGAITSVLTWYTSIKRSFTSDELVTSHVCGLCVASLEVRTGSWPALQAADPRFYAGMIRSQTDQAQVGYPSHPVCFGLHGSLVSCKMKFSLPMMSSVWNGGLSRPCFCLRWPQQGNVRIYTFLVWRLHSWGNIQHLFNVSRFRKLVSE